VHEGEKGGLMGSMYGIFHLIELCVVVMDVRYCHKTREFVGLSSCIRDQPSLALMGKKSTASSFTKVHGEHVPKHTP
jgi:hypothetical protein